MKSRVRHQNYIISSSCPQVSFIIFFVWFLYKIVVLQYASPKAVKRSLKSKQMNLQEGYTSSFKDCPFKTLTFTHFPAKGVLAYHVTCP
ncbi:Uncharacterized protein TCM_038441 [Theobroma cacao]|uniref:Uncharacterized protein n=1 Tax=Theobroma cacao TaxID=3641 RepID=A0A061GPR6_THECC|nr:Uncharacterized protein TCM_038441 [Theobroma cacao]